MNAARNSACSVVVAVTIAGAALIGASAPPSVVVEKPKQNEAVGVHYDVRGRVSDRTAKVWLVVHPIETADCWVQNPILVNNDATWQVYAQFGEDRADHKGKRYEIRALANPKGTLAPGRVTCWPEAEAWSDAVQVVRQ